jgi:hypothetical protein
MWALIWTCSATVGDTDFGRNALDPERVLVDVAIFWHINCLDFGYFGNINASKTIKGLSADGNKNMISLKDIERKIISMEAENNLKDLITELDYEKAVWNVDGYSTFISLRNVYTSMHKTGPRAKLLKPKRDKLIAIIKKYEPYFKKSSPGLKNIYIQPGNINLLVYCTRDKWNRFGRSYQHSIKSNKFNQHLS